MSVQRFVGGIGVALVLVLAAPNWAAAQPQAAPRRIDPQAMTRYQIAVMEGILETAVQRGARTISREWRAVAPDMMMLSGAARARGFRLPGYGLFFDVEVPALSQSVFWSWSVLNRDTSGVSNTLQAMREMIKTVTDPALKRDLEANLKRLELQVGPLPKSPDAGNALMPGPRPGDLGPAVGTPAPVQAGGPPTVVRAEPELGNPNEAYTNEVRNSLIDAMLDYSNSLPIEHEEWLTIAARDSGDRRVEMADPYDYMTIQIRIKGSDLIALRTGKITREEAHKRVEVREF